MMFAFHCRPVFDASHLEFPKYVDLMMMARSSGNFYVMVDADSIMSLSAH